MKNAKKTREIYNKKGKMYMFKGFNDGFIADGSMNPIHFSLAIETLYRRSLEDIKVKDHREHAYESEIWEVQSLIEMIFDKDTVLNSNLW